jgi:hypothetical protein
LTAGAAGWADNDDGAPSKSAIIAAIVTVTTMGRRIS